jgi:hypothetical protein
MFLKPLFGVPMIQCYSLAGCLMGACLDAIPSRATGRRGTGIRERDKVFQHWMAVRKPQSGLNVSTSMLWVSGLG